MTLWASSWQSCYKFVMAVQYQKQMHMQSERRHKQEHKIQEKEFWWTQLVHSRIFWLGTGRLGPSQDVNFFYMGSHLSELQCCELILSTNFYFIFSFKYSTIQFSLWIVLLLKTVSWNVPPTSVVVKCCSNQCDLILWAALFLALIHYLFTGIQSI